MPTFVKIEKGIVDQATFDKHVAAHHAYVKGLVSEGRKARSGYWGELGGGMLIFEAASLEEARSVVEKDPLIVNACVSWELHEWKVVVG